MRFLTRLTVLVGLLAPPIAAQSAKQVLVTCLSTTLALGTRTTCTQVTRLANGAYTTLRPVTWSSSKPDVAIVSATGIVSTITAGVATVTATVGAANGSAVVTVTSTAPSPPPLVVHTVTSVSVSLASPSLTAGQTTQAAAVARDSSGDVVTGLATGWTSLAPSIASVSTNGVVTALTAGSASIRATVSTQHADATLAVDTAATSAPDTTTIAPTLPALLTTTVASTPSVTRTIHVTSGGNLQVALDTARGGDKILVSCTRRTGNYVLRSANTGWVTVQSDCAIPAEGTRADTTHTQAILVSPTVLPVIVAAPGAAHWRLIGMELTSDATLTSVNGIVELGDGQATANSQLPRGIILDRVYVHSWPNQWVHRCIAVNGDSLAVIDSYVSECHADIDAQAIWGWSGNGPFKFVNNYLEASTEVIGFGGADPKIANLVPSDIEIRGNHITKQLAWKGDARWLEKNLIEFKLGRRVLIDGNVLQNAWPNGQIGYAFVLWSVNQQGSCTWCVLEHVTVRNNLVQNVAAGFQLSAFYSGSPSPAMNHVSIHDNVFVGIDNAAVVGGGITVQVSGNIPSLAIEHNTAFNPGTTGGSATFIWYFGPTSHQIIRNNLMGGGQYVLFATPSNTWASIADTTSRFTGNVIVGGSAYSASYPTGNFYPASFSLVGLAGGASAALSVTATLDSLALTSGSTYHHAGTDGKDIGADIAAVKAATAGVVKP